MTINQLRYLLLIHQLGSINKAAQKSMISPQNVSVAIKKLEEELGYPLFIRDGRKKLVLSEYGHVFIKTAEEVVASIDSAIKQLETLHDTEIAAQPKKALNILISPALGLYNLPGITKAFLQQYPYIHLKIMQHETEEIQRLLTEGNALGIFATFAAPPRDDALIHYDFLFSDKLYIAISPLHPLAKQKSVSLRTLLKYPLAIYQNSYAYANPLCHLLEQYGQPDYYTMTNNIDIYQNAIINNHAVGFHVKSAFQKNTAFPQISSDILTMPIKNAPPLFVYLGVEKNYFQANRDVINAFLEVYLTFI